MESQLTISDLKTQQDVLKNSTNRNINKIRKMSMEELDNIINTNSQNDIKFTISNNSVFNPKHNTTTEFFKSSSNNYNKNFSNSCRNIYETSNNINSFKYRNNFIHSLANNKSQNQLIGSQLKKSNISINNNSKSTQDYIKSLQNKISLLKKENLDIKKELEKLKNNFRTELQKVYAKKEPELLQNISQKFQNKIDNINSENKKLIDENLQLKNHIKNFEQEILSIERRYKYYSTKMTAENNDLRQKTKTLQEQIEFIKEKYFIAQTKKKSLDKKYNELLTASRNKNYITSKIDNSKKKLNSSNSCCSLFTTDDRYSNYSKKKSANKNITPDKNINKNLYSCNFKNQVIDKKNRRKLFNKIPIRNKVIKKELISTFLDENDDMNITAIYKDQNGCNNNQIILDDIENEIPIVLNAIEKLKNENDHLLDSLDIAFTMEEKNNINLKIKNIEEQIKAKNINLLNLRTKQQELLKSYLQ